MNKIEKFFFDTFGIKSYYKYLLLDKTSRNYNVKLFNKTDFINFVKSGKDYLLFKVIKYYPEITSDILLELICITLQQYCNYSGNINIKNIKTLEQALSIIHKLARGLNNCYQSGFNVCPKCGEIATKNYIYWNCGYDFSE